MHLLGQKKAQNVPKLNLNAKAVLLSGPPGIGKTTAVRVVAGQLGFKVLEWNASDVRNKKGMDNELRHLVTNTVMGGD